MDGGGVEIQGLQEVMATVGFIPSGLIGALAERNYDLVDHHRRTVLKTHDMPAGLRATRWLATRLHRYGATTPSPTTLDELQGESFAAGQPEKGILDPKRIASLEDGGDVHTREQMAIPFGAGVQHIAGREGTPTAAFTRALERREFDIIDTPRARGLLILELNARRGKHAIGQRTAIMGVLRRSRHQRKMIGFYQSWGDILPRHLPRYDQAVDMSLTAAGQAALEHRTQTRHAGRVAWKQEFERFLGAHPGNFRGAKQAAISAARAARSLNLSRGGKV